MDLDPDRIYVDPIHPTLAFVYFGCGVLETEDGGKVLLVMQGRKSTEILDLKATNWAWKKRKLYLGYLGVYDILTVEAFTKLGL